MKAPQSSHFLVVCCVCMCSVARKCVACPRSEEPERTLLYEPPMSSCLLTSTVCWQAYMSKWYSRSFTVTFFSTRMKKKKKKVFNVIACGFVFVWFVGLVVLGIQLAE